MKKTVIIIIGASASVIILALVVNLTGLWPFLNRPLNYIVSGSPDKSCAQDSDCVIRQTDCGYCSCGEAVNKDWQQYCPFKTHYIDVLCKPCSAGQIQCVAGQCQQKELIPEVTDFLSCAAAGNPIMESYPRQCRANGQTYVEVINTNLNSNANINDNVNAPGEPTCKNMCGDGICAEIVCLAIGCPCSETVSSCPQDCKNSAGDTGVVSGTVLLGPTCPVVKDPPDPSCADKPYETTIQVIAVGSPLSSPFKVINTDAQGNYTVTLPVGAYALQPQGGSVMPRCETRDVTVTSGANLKVDLACDTGIR
jgi:hypothetical protein